MSFAVIDHVVVNLVGHDCDIGNLARPATSWSTCVLGVTPPVGLAGELRIRQPVCVRDQRKRLLRGEGEGVLSRTGTGIGRAP